MSKDADLFYVTLALEALAEGRLPAEAHAPVDPRLALALGRVSRRLQADEARTRDPAEWLARHGGPGHGHVYAAILAPHGLGDAGSDVGQRIAEEAGALAREKIAQLLPGARLGRATIAGVEFAFESADDAQAHAQLLRLRERLDARARDIEADLSIEFAVGFARHDLCRERAFVCAAAALLEAQASEGRVVQFRKEDLNRTASRMALLRDLREAVATDQLFVVYQPKVRTSSGRIEAAEALVRWRHPSRGLVPPDEFVHLAEESGLIGELSRWVILKSLADQKTLAAQGHDLAIHVNISGRLVADARFTAWALDAISTSRCGDFGIEVTETAVIDDPEAGLAHLRAFAEAGITIALDDYGSGLSSLTYLKQLPATELKIDRLFISGLTSSHLDPLLVRSTIDLAHALGMEVTAEGVESPLAYALLRTMGCDLVQGYFVSKPLELADLGKFVASGPLELGARTNLLNLGNSVASMKKKRIPG